MTTARIAHIKDNINDRQQLNGWFELERIKMRFYRETNGEAPIMKRARMLDRLVHEMPIRIEPGELIVGSQDDCFATSYNLFKSGLEDFEGYCGYPDLYNELHGLSEAEAAPVRNFWVDEQFERTLSAMWTEEERAAMSEVVVFAEPVTGHTIADYGKVLRKGFLGIITEIEERQRETRQDIEKQIFYEALKLACRAPIALAERYAALAEATAAQEEDPSRRDDLLRIAATCRKVPAQPAESFHEAVQAFWLTWMTMVVEQTPNPYAFSIGRLDQFLWPYYQADRARGGITREAALEVLENLFLKFIVGKRYWAVSQNLMIGGVTRDGKDASNELTYLVLDAMEDLRTPQPSISFRYHQGTPPELLRRVSRLLSKGLGMPAIHNDESVIKSEVLAGKTLEDARDYGISGCQEPVVQGCENARTTSVWFNLLKCLELALNNGRSLLTGRQLGLQTGAPEDFRTFQDLQDAFHTQVEHFLKLGEGMHNRSDRLLAELRPVPFLSAIMDDCIAKGEDFRSTGARYNHSGCFGHGVGNVADSLMAIKRLVFERKETSMKELRDALANNWEGQEWLRQRFINGAPKYGNDDDEVDTLAANLAMHFATHVSDLRNAWGGVYRPGFSTPSTHVLYGRWVGATPEGRKARETLAYGIGPMQGRVHGGPTAVMKSVTKFPHWAATHGLSFSQSLTPMAVAGDEGLEKLSALIRTYMQLGGHYVYINITDPATLREAQRHPEQYGDLVVRVHGMSAFFVNLDPLIQEDVITRAESSL